MSGTEKVEYSIVASPTPVDAVLGCEMTEQGKPIENVPPPPYTPGLPPSYPSQGYAIPIDQGYPYPPAPGQGYHYPPGHGQPYSYPSGQLQTYTLPPGQIYYYSPPPGQGQPYALPPGQGQPYALPPGQGQPYALPPGQAVVVSPPPNAQSPKPTAKSGLPCRDGFSTLCLIVGIFVFGSIFLLILGSAWKDSLDTRGSNDCKLVWTRTCTSSSNCDFILEQHCCKGDKDATNEQQYLYSCPDGAVDETECSDLPNHDIDCQTLTDMENANIIMGVGIALVSIMACVAVCAFIGCFGSLDCLICCCDDCSVSFG